MTEEQAKSYLRSLYNNNEEYHPEDDATDILWSMNPEDKPTGVEMIQMNKLMDMIYGLPNFDPCEWLLIFQAEKNINHLLPVKLKDPEEGEEKLIFTIVNYNEVTGRCYIQCNNSGMTIQPQELVSIQDIGNA